MPSAASAGSPDPAGARYHAHVRALALILTSLAVLACTGPNDLFVSGTGGASESGSTTAATTTIPTTGSGTGAAAQCRPLEPRGDGVATCELDAPVPLDIALHPALMGSCDGAPVERWALRPEGDDGVVQLCDEGCGTCDPAVTIDLDDPAYQFLVPFGILAPPGECMRVVHEGVPGLDDTCKTAKIAVWDATPLAPRFVAGVDTLDTFPEIALGIAGDEPWLCMCAEADKDDYPCCNYVVEYRDLIVTSSDGCPFRVARGTENLLTFDHLGAVYDFTLLNAYAFNGCPADDTIYWIMKRR